jgi:hypothetical protein
VSQGGASLHASGFCMHNGVFCIAEMKAGI